MRYRIANRNVKLEMANSKTNKLDAIDRKILALLMKNCDIPINELSKKVGLSQTPCWHRVQKLEAIGIIKGRVALVDAKMVGLGLTIIVSIEANEHTVNWLTQFTTYINKSPEVVEVLRMAGDVDYILKLIVPDMAAYDKFYKELIAKVPMKNVSSRFVMETIKSTTELALPQIAND